MGKLTATKVKALLEKPGRYSDGDGLLLFVKSPGQALWVAGVQQNKTCGATQRSILDESGATRC